MYCARDFHGILVNVYESAIQINITNVQGDCFAPSQPGVREEQNHGPVLLCVGSEELDPRVAQISVLALSRHDVIHQDISNESASIEL